MYERQTEKVLREFVCVRGRVGARLYLYVVVV